MNRDCLAVLSMLLAMSQSGASARAETPFPVSSDFVIRGARVFDGARVVDGADVWVRHGHVQAVGRHLHPPGAVPIVDGTGKTLLPGLIDSHVHTMGETDFLRSALALGITTELDMGSAPEFADRIEREQAAGKDLDMADLRSSRTQPTAPDGHGTEYGIPIPTLSSPEEAQGLVDALIAEGADFIGEIVYDDGSEFGLRLPTLTRETLRAVIDAAHRRGKVAVVHVLSLQGAKDAVDAGADGLAHLFADAPPDDELVALVKQHGTFVIPTLSLFASMTGSSMGPGLASDPRLEPYLGPQAIADLRTALPASRGSLANTQEAVRRLNEAGTRILAGTDAHNPGTTHGATLLDEVRLLVDSGLTPVQALAAATSVNAAAFHLDDRGAITPGKRADLVLVDGDPTTNVSDLKYVVRVWKLGVEHVREATRAALQAKKEQEAAQRRSEPPQGSESGLVSDFESGMATSFGLGWKASTGRLLGGSEPRTELRLADDGAAGSHHSLEISGAIAPGVFGWAGAVFFPGARPLAPVNLSQFKSISFWTRGDGRTYQVMLLSRSRGSMPLSQRFVAGEGWSRVTISLSELGTDGSDMQALTFAELAVPGSFRFLIDDVRFER